MAASRRIVVTGAIVVAGALIACTGILGIDNYKEVPCRFEAGCDDQSAADIVLDTTDSSSTQDVGSDAAPDIGSTDVVITPEANLFWARWRMPNPADAASMPGLDGAVDGARDCASSLLPNAVSYDASAEAGDGGIDTVYDNVTQLTWQMDGSTHLTTAVEASNYCATLGPGSWRLPTRIELVSLIDFTRNGPSIDPVFSGTQSDTYWSSSVASGDPAHYWMVSFTDGTVSTGTANNVRCVQVSP
jgi:hypothetical protein